MHRSVLVVVVMLLVACSRGDTPSPKPTEAPKPAAEAPKPQSAALPADPAGIVEMFRAKNLPVGQSVVFTAENDPNKLLGRPNQYTGKANFLDTRLARETANEIKADDGGTVETFADENAAKARHTYVSEIAKGSPAFAEYAYVEGKVLVRLSKRLTPEQAGQYETLLKNPAAVLPPLPTVAAQPASKPDAKPSEKPSAPAPAPAIAAQRVRVTGAGADGVNMRAEPSAAAARVKLLKDGTQLELVGEDRQADGRAWRNVKDPSDGATGWIAAEFVAAAEGAPPAEKPSAPAPTAGPKPAAPAKPAGGAIVCKDGSTWGSSTRQGACSGRGGIAPGY